ncbi:hypothetical protein IAT38_002309 [Cryptococcus sp. DSM 104549]
MFTSPTKLAPSRPVPRKRVPSTLSPTLANAATPPPTPPAPPILPASATPPPVPAPASKPDAAASATSDSARPAPVERLDNPVRESKRKREVMEVEDRQAAGKHEKDRGSGRTLRARGERKEQSGKDLDLYFACRAKELDHTRYWDCIGASIMLDVINFGLALLFRRSFHWNFTPYFFVSILWAGYRPTSLFQRAPSGFSASQWATSLLCTAVSVCLLVGAVLGSAPWLADALLPVLEWFMTAKEGGAVVKGDATVADMATKTVYVVLNSKGARAGRSRAV